MRKTKIAVYFFISIASLLTTLQTFGQQPTNTQAPKAPPPTPPAPPTQPGAPTGTVAPAAPGSPETPSDNKGNALHEGETAGKVNNRKYFSKLMSPPEIQEILNDGLRKQHPKVKYPDFSFELKDNMDATSLATWNKLKGELSDNERDAAIKIGTKYCETVTAKYSDSAKRDQKMTEFDFDLVAGNCERVGHALFAEPNASAFPYAYLPMYTRNMLDMRYTFTDTLSYAAAKKVNDMGRAYKASPFGKAGLPYETGLLLTQVMAVVSSLISLILLIRMFMS